MAAFSKLTAGRVTLVTLTLVLSVLGTPSRALQFNLVSDEHYDPGYGTSEAYGSCTSSSSSPFGSKGCDSPVALLSVVTTDMSLRKSSYTMFMGDWQRHAFDGSGFDTSDIFGYLSELFSSITTDGKMTGSNVMAVLGNNDMVPYYNLDVANPGQNVALNAQAALMQQNGLITTAESSSMSQCGYYSRSASPTLRIIGLHSVLWTYKLKPALDDTNTDPCGQLAWLESEVAAARSAGQQVFVVGHIPPQPDVFGVIQRGVMGSVSDDMYWKPQYQTAYTSIMNSNSDIIKAQFYGHTHRFAVLADEAMKVPLYVINGVTPLYGNAPSYMVGKFDDNTWDLQSLQQRTFSTTTMWTNGLEVAQAMGFNNLSDIASMQQAITNLFTDDQAWTNYMTLRTGGIIDDPCTNEFCRVYTVCTMLYAGHSDIQACVNGRLDSSSASGSASSSSNVQVANSGASESSSSTGGNTIPGGASSSKGSSSSSASGSGTSGEGSVTVPPATPYTALVALPAYHIRPSKNWINDPNGPYRDPVTGKIHLYMQYNPNGPLWGDIAWYHFTSTDYVKWTPEEPPIAMYADKWYDRWGVYSGTMMDNNHSEPVAIYTCAEPENQQRQCIANPKKRDVEGKRQFNELEKSPLNPILSEGDVPGLVGTGNFRDPTEWWEDPTNPGTWLIAFVARIADDEGDNAHVVIFKTQDPTFQTGYSFSHSMYVYKYDLDHMFECPDFYTLQPGGEHFLKVSTMPSHRDYIIYGSYEADSEGKYVFVEDTDRTPTFMDYGPFYASKTFHDPILNRRTVWGWTNDELSDEQITANGWSGVQNLLRAMEYDTAEKKMKTYPVPETKALRLDKVQEMSSIVVTSTPTSVVGAGSNATRYHEIIVTFTVSDPTVFSATATYTDANAPEVGVMIRANSDLSTYSTVAVRMPSGSATATANTAQVWQYQPIKIFDGPDAANCSATCNHERLCESYTYFSSNTTCVMFWKTNPTTMAYDGATTGTVREPQLYMDRSASGSTGSSLPLHGRAPFTASTPNEIQLHIYVDDSVVESFKDGGLETLTGRLYLPTAESQTGIAVYAKNMGGATVTADVKVFTMDSIWKAKQPSVLRNYTDSLYELMNTIFNVPE